MSKKFTLKSLNQAIKAISANFEIGRHGQNHYIVYCRWSEGTTGFSLWEGMKTKEWRGRLHDNSKAKYLQAIHQLEKQFQDRQARVAS